MGWLLPAASRGAVPSPRAQPPRARACLHPRGQGLPGLGGGPARYASRGRRPRPRLTPGWAQGRRCRGRGLGEPVPRGPGTVWKEPWVKRSPLLPGSSSPLYFGPPSCLLFGVRLSVCWSVWVRPGRRGVAVGAGAPGPAYPRSATRPLGPRPPSFASGGSAPESSFPHLDARTPAHPTPRPFSLIPEASRLGSWTALSRGVPRALGCRPAPSSSSEAQCALQVCLGCGSLWEPRPPRPLRPRRPLGGAGTSARLWPRLLFQVR